MRIPKLPHEIIADVLSRLPVKSVIQFRCVCKEWNSLISDRHFVRTHLDKAVEDSHTNRRRLLLSTDPFQSIDYETGATALIDFPWRSPDQLYDDVHFVGSCNGLVCVVVEDDNVILWNPSTRDAKVLPEPSGGPSNSFHFELGYDFSTDDYKVVGIRSSDKSTIEIFSLKTNSWRTIQLTLPSLGGQGFFLNGALHWLSQGELGKNVIVSFDLAAEKFLEVVQLPDYDHTRTYDQQFCILGGCLSILNDCGDFLDLWVMKEYGVKGSWTKLVAISRDKLPHEYGLSPLCFSKNGEVLIDVDERELIVYDLKGETWRYLVEVDSDWFKTTMYIESLVSPNIPSHK